MARKNRFVYFNPNPKIKYKKDGTPYSWSRCDCSVRAVSCALDISWERAYELLCVAGAAIYDMPDTKEAIGKVLCDNGFEYVKLSKPERGMRRNTVYETAAMMKKSKLVANCTGHVVCIKDGKYHDTGDSGNMAVFSYWLKK